MKPPVGGATLSPLFRHYLFYLFMHSCVNACNGTVSMIGVVRNPKTKRTKPLPLRRLESNIGGTW